jgi:hypothetical protein
MSHRHHVLVGPLPLPDTCSSGTWWSAITRLTLPSRLRRHVARLDREPRIDRGPEIMNLDLAGSARSTDTSATPAARVSSLTMVPTPRARPLRGRF